MGSETSDTVSESGAAADDADGGERAKADLLLRRLKIRLERRPAAQALPGALTDAEKKLIATARTSIAKAVPGGHAEALAAAFAAAEGRALADLAKQVQAARLKDIREDGDIESATALAGIAAAGSRAAALAADFLAEDDRTAKVALAKALLNAGDRDRKQAAAIAAVTTAPYTAAVFPLWADYKATDKTDAAAYDAIIDEINAAAAIDKLSIQSQGYGYTKGDRLRQARSAKYDDLPDHHALLNAFRRADDVLTKALAQRDFKGAEAVYETAVIAACDVCYTLDTVFVASDTEKLLARADEIIAGLKDRPNDEPTQNLIDRYHDERDVFEDLSRAPNERAGALADMASAAKNIHKFAVGPAVDAKYKEMMKGGGIPADGEVNYVLAVPDSYKNMSEKDKLAAVNRKRGNPITERELKDIYINAERRFGDIAATPAQLAAIKTYSGPDFAEINKVLREGNPDSWDVAEIDRFREANEDILVLIALVQEGLAALPTYDRTGYPLFRFETPYKSPDGAIDYIEQRYRPGQEFMIKEFWSTGAGGGSIVDDSPVSAEILIFPNPRKPPAGKDISMISSFETEGGRADKARLKGQGSGEVLFPAGSSFRCIRRTVFDQENRHVREMVNSYNKPKSNVFTYRIEVQEI